MKAALTTIVVIAFVALAISCEAYKFNDCKKVGHGTFYCVLNVGH